MKFLKNNQKIVKEQWQKKYIKKWIYISSNKSASGYVILSLELKININWLGFIW